MYESYLNLYSSNVEKTRDLSSYTNLIQIDHTVDSKL